MAAILSYSDCNTVGFTRKSTVNGFNYFNSNTKIKDQDVLQRISSLKIPPAWEKVWICIDAKGHIQATGYDVRGRKQYIYHPSWVQQRKIQKFEEMKQFGEKLPLLLMKVKSDLRSHTLNQKKICAFAVYLMSETFIRVGNKNYEKNYGSFGLTTLKNRHISLNSNSVLIKFIGKKGVKQQIKLTDRQVSSFIKRMKELPGQNLFQYYDDNMEVKQLNSSQVNEYLKDVLGIDISSKDFRTWGASSTALFEILNRPIPPSPKEKENELREIIKLVANKLGNTVGVAKKYYIHPSIQQNYLNGNLDAFIRKNARKIQSQKPSDKLRLLLLDILEEKGS